MTRGAAIGQDAAMPTRFVLLGLAVATSLAACGGSDPAPVDVPFGTMGPLVGDAGKGGFRFGAASAATQIEDGNVNTDWYVFTQPEADGGLGHDTFVGDAAMGYTKAIEDVGLLSDMHLDSYRFSIEWSRVEPQRDQWDEAALQHYDEVIDSARARGLRPVITLHHFTDPRWFFDGGGWERVDERGRTIALDSPASGSITLEPGGQFELSGAPYADVKGVDAELAAFNRRVDELLAGTGYQLDFTASGLTGTTTGSFDVASSGGGGGSGGGDGGGDKGCSTSEIKSPIRNAGWLLLLAYVSIWALRRQKG